MLAVLALTVAACWPALGVLFAGSSAAAAAAPTPVPTQPVYIPPPLPTTTTTTPSPSPTTTPGQTVLTVVAPSYVIGADDSLWDTVAADFHAANPTITVKVQQERNRPVSTTDAFAAGPDLMVGVPVDDFTGHDLGLFYSADEIEPAHNDILPSFGYLESTVDETGKNKRIGIPFTASALELFYNKKIFAQAHIARPPQTWNELLADAVKINSLGKTGYGLAMGGVDTLSSLQMWAKGNGGGLMNAAKAWTLNQQANVDALRWLETNLIFTDLTAFGSPPLNSEKVFFAEGDTGMTVADPGLIKQAEAGTVGSAFGVAPMPGRYGLTNYSLGSVDDLIATKTHPESKDALAKFVAFLLQPKYQKQFADLAGTLPVTRSGVAAESGNPLLKPFLDALPTVDWLPTHAPGWSSLADYAGNVVDQIHDPKAFLDHAQAVATGKAVKS